MSESPDPRQRVIETAFALFDERGYDQTTVEDIAGRAGVGRTTFFRLFRTKEQVVFPAHEDLLAAIEARLTTAGPGTERIALFEASGLVMRHYLAEGEHARVRYRLTREVEALRERERASITQYERLFRRFIHQWWGGSPDMLLRAELAANAVVTAHNHVLRAWLKGAIDAEEALPWFRAVIMELDLLLGRSDAGDRAPGAEQADIVPGRPAGAAAGGSAGGAPGRTGAVAEAGATGTEPAVIVIKDANQLEDLLPRIRELLQ